MTCAAWRRDSEGDACHRPDDGGRLVTRCRLTLAAGSVPNTRGWLQAWIIDAQALEPGSKMPSLKSFDGETLNALTAYLESLQ